TEYQAWLNLGMGELYEEKAVSIRANALQLNIRHYPIGVVPDKLSVSDGNGNIILLTLACDLNGVTDDARLDWEVVGWSESGSCYSIKHGSIGTFIPREGQSKYKVDREKWTYNFYHEKSVWPVLDEIIKSS